MMRTIVQRHVGRILLALFLALANVACGFHLRGVESIALPESLARLRVTVQDSKLANDPLLVAMKSALQADPKVVITDAADAPQLILSGEATHTDVLSVSTTGRASGYTLKYEVSYRLLDARGKELAPARSIRLLRDYTFDPVNVLAKEQEEQELKRAMQREAIQHILRRLSRHTPDVSDTAPANASQR